MALRLVTDATVEPVSLEDLKLHLRINSTETDEDVLLNRLIGVARKDAENRTKRACLPQTWKLTLDRFATEMILPVAPLSSSSSDVTITFLDSVSGDSTTLDSTYYTIDSDTEPGRVRLAYGSEWPDHYPVPNAVSIQFISGYPLAATTPATNTTPDGMKTWILMRAAALYENRESHQDRPPSDMPHSMFDGLLDPYVLIEVNP